MKIDSAAIGSAIRELRVKQGLKQEDVAEKCDITVNFLSLLENGKRGISFPTLNQLAKVFDVLPPIITFMGTVPDEEDDEVTIQLMDQFKKLINATFTARSAMK